MRPLWPKNGGVSRWFEDEIWVFGAVSNGVLAEIQIANKEGRTVRYFAIEKPHKIVETTKDKIDMEAEVADLRHLL